MGYVAYLFDVPDSLCISLYPALCSKRLVHMMGINRLPCPLALSVFCFACGGATQHVVSVPHKDRTHAPKSRSEASLPLNCQGISSQWF